MSTIVHDDDVCTTTRTGDTRMQDVGLNVEEPHRIDSELHPISMLNQGTKSKKGVVRIKATLY